MKSTDSLQLVNNLQQAGKIHNLQQAVAFLAACETGRTIYYFLNIFH